MKRRGQITAFYIETLLMITVMTGIILLLTQILAVSRREQVQARRLTQAVTIAQSAAEAASGARQLKDLGDALMLEAFQEEKSEDGDQTFSGIYHWDTGARTEEDEPAGQDQYLVRISRSQEEGLRTDTIRILTAPGEEEIYSLTVKSAEP